MEQDHSYRTSPATSIRPVISVGVAGFRSVLDFLENAVVLTFLFAAAGMIVLLIIFIKHSRIKGMNYFEMSMTRVQAQVTAASAQPHSDPIVRSLRWN
jgi:hypothetical protein